MPAPVTADELLDLIQRSGVADETKLRTYVQKLTQGSGIPTDPAKFAGVLVRDGVLTYFQAEQLLQGKYKRFTIGKYKVLEKLGAGGMAQVFLCEHKLMRRRVAIKVLPTAKADDPSSLERFYREAKAVAAVDHPNIVRAYDIDQDENLHFLVMEYVDGTNLQDLVKKFGPLDVLRACHYIYGASVGLQHAFEMGLVHRDIKPGNILVDRAGVVKILDMGLARFFNDEEDVLTKKYDENVLGTADYLAPEQALESHTVDIRADIYSLGATFYYLLTGSAPFPEGSVAQKLIWHQNRQPRAIKAIRPEVPDEVIAVVDKMMAKDQDRRLPGQTPSDVMTALAAWVTTPIPPPTDREMPHVSPAAGGMGGRGPASMVGVAPAPAPAGAGVFTRTSGTAAPAVTPAPNGPPPLPSSGSSGNPAVWESLDTDDDTQSVARGDTARPGPQTPSPRRRMTTSPQAGGSKTLLYTGIGLVGLVVVAAVVYFAFLKKKTSPPSEHGSPAPAQKITVADGGGDATTLREALSKIGPGGTIVIAKAKLTEPHLKLDRVKHKDLTIEGTPTDGKLPVIEATGGGKVMLDATDVEGFQLKNVEFDGKGQAEVGVLISGSCPGLTVENVTIRGTKTAGVKLFNAAGIEGRPVLLDRVRVLTAPTQTGVWVYAAGVESRRVTIRNARFEGGGNGVGVRVEGASADLEITGNRFFNLDAAVVFHRPPTAKATKALVTSNTIYLAKFGLLFDLPVPVPNEPPMGDFSLNITQNYFAQTNQLGQLATAQGPTGAINSADNAFFESNGGNVAVNATPLASPQLPAPDPNNDATFLRFPNGPPDVAGKKVGAP